MAAANWVEPRQTESKPFKQYLLERTVMPLHNFIISATAEFVALRLAEEKDHILIFHSAEMKEVGQLKNQDLLVAYPIPNKNQFATVSRKGLVQMWDLPSTPGEQKPFATLTSQFPIDNPHDEPKLIAAELKDDNYVLVLVRKERARNVVINRIDSKEDKLLDPVPITLLPVETGKYSVSQHLLYSQFLMIGIDSRIVFFDLKSKDKTANHFNCYIENQPHERKPIVSPDGKILTVVECNFYGRNSFSKWEFNSSQQSFYPTLYNEFPFFHLTTFIGFMHGELVFADPQTIDTWLFFSIDPFNQNITKRLGTGNFIFEHPQGIAVYNRDHLVKIYETNNMKSIQEISRNTSTILEEKGKLPPPLQKLICRLAFFDQTMERERPYIKKLDQCIQQLQNVVDKLFKQVDKLKGKNRFQKFFASHEKIKLELAQATEMLVGLQYLENHLENSTGQYPQILQEMLTRYKIWFKISREKNWRPSFANEIGNDIFEIPFAIALFENVRHAEQLRA